MKPHALVIALSALSAGTATAQTVGDRYGYDRPAYAPPSAYGTPYASQQAQPAVGRTLTWANKSAYSAPAPSYDSRYQQSAYPPEQYAPPSRDYGPAPYAQAPQAQAPQYQAGQYQSGQMQSGQTPGYAPQYAQPYDRTPQPAQAYAQPGGYAPYTPQEPYSRPLQRPVQGGDSQGGYSQSAYAQPAYTQPAYSQPAYASPAYPQPQQYAEPPAPRYEPATYIPPSRGPTTYIPVARPDMIQPSQAERNGARIEMSPELSGGPPEFRPAAIEQYPAMPPASPVMRVPARASIAQPVPPPMRVADAQPAERSQVHYYSLHRAYGLTPDTIPAPDPSRGMVLIGPGDSASAPKGSSDKDDETASEKPF